MTDMIRRSKKEKDFVTLFPDSNGGKHDLMWKRLEGLFPDARDIDIDTYDNKQNGE